MTDGTLTDAVDIGQQGENGRNPNININAHPTTTTSSSPPLDSQLLPDIPQKEQDESTLPDPPASFTHPPVPIVTTPKETLEAALQGELSRSEANSLGNSSFGSES